jgi:nitroreductase
MQEHTSKFFERYSGLMGANEYPVNEAIESIINRTTVRWYDPTRSIPDQLFQKLICAAQSSPTSSMAQAWSVISIKNKETHLKFINDNVFQGHLGISSEKDTLNKLALETCERLLIWLVDMHRLQVIFDNNKTNVHLNEKKFEAKNSLDLMHYELRSIIDTCIAAQTFAISAELEGLGVMYCGSFRTMDLKQTLDLPDYVLPLFGMTIGYPKPDYKKSILKTRLQQNLVVHEESYKPADISELVKYNKTITQECYNKLPWGDGLNWFEKIILRTQPFSQTTTYPLLAQQQGYKFK